MEPAFVIIDSQHKFNQVGRWPHGFDCYYEMGPLKDLYVEFTIGMPTENERLRNIQKNLLNNNATIESLKVLMPYASTISEKFTSVFRTMSKLRSLTLCFNTQILDDADALVNDIVECKGLEELTIEDHTWHRNLDFSKLIAGLDKCPCLSKLSVKVDSDDALVLLGKLMRSLKTLKQVHLQLSKELTNVGASAFTTNIPMYVKCLDINYNIHIPTLKMLQQSAKNLQELSFSPFYVTTEYQQEVAEILNKSQSLRIFTMDHSGDFYTTLDESIVEALQQRTLEKLNVKKLRIDSNFHKALNSLKIVKFEQCRFANLESFFATLAKNTTIKALEMIDTAFAKQHCVDIKHMLQKNCTLTELNLKNHHVTTDGAKEICVGLQSNKSVLKFHLPGQMLGPSVYESINTVLQMNDILEELTISFIFSVEEFKQICTGLKSNKSLTSLQFVKKPEFDCGETLLELLEDNFVLQKVHYLEKDNELQAKVEKMLQRNQAISEATKKDMIVLFYNIKRSTEALQLCPIEVWFQIFSQVRIGYRCSKTAESILLYNK